jgi:hypothetical protein
MEDIQKIYRAIKDPKILFKIEWLDEDEGYHYKTHGGRRIAVNPFDKIVEIIVHECLHDIYISRSEGSILKLEKRIVRALSFRQKKHILRLFAKRVSW